MVKRNVKPDVVVDNLYARLRDTHGGGDSKANGYLWHGYFEREQEILFSMLNPHAEILIDIACGSGLMCQPLVSQRSLVAGLDFNAAACIDAAANGIEIVRGDAFNLPFASACADEIVCCQFFNQQSSSAVQSFIGECARVLRANGRVIMVWRNGEAWVHRAALAVLRSAERLRKRPRFPYENHAISQLRTYAESASLTMEYSAVSFPPLGWRSEQITSRKARLFGASNICILRKPDNG